MKYVVRNKFQTVEVELPPRSTFRQVLDAAVEQGWKTNPTPWKLEPLTGVAKHIRQNDGFHFPEFAPILINDYKILARDNLDTAGPATYYPDTL